MLFMDATNVLIWVQTAANGIVAAAQLVQTVILVDLLRKITDGAWLFEQARKFCIEFDQKLVKYSEKVYGYFCDIVGGTLLTSDIVESLMSRVYIIVGLFIFFKLAMVAIKYMMNPEQFLDDKVGAQTLVKRIVLGSVLIIMLPMIFNFASKLQASIIADRVIEKIILPEDAYKELINTRNPGRDLSMMVFLGFFNWNSDVNQDNIKTVANSFNKVITYNDLTLFNKDLINKKDNNVYAIDYVPIISTLAVGYLLFMLIKFALEVAFRSFKLVFLQILSPFVIVNYMLDTSKEEVMKKWVNTTIATYIMIFIRVVTIWFASLICYYFTKGVNGTSLLNTEDPWLKALIILAVFAFLKDLPKLITEIFGYNVQENETIGGIMNQGVGIIKGFAMGQVALGATSGLRTASMVTTGISSVGGAAGGASQALKDGLGAKGAVNAGFANTSGGMASIGSNAMSSISGAMGGTMFSPIAQTASSSSQIRTFDERQRNYGRSSNHSNDEGSESKLKKSKDPQVQNFNNYTEKLFSDSHAKYENFKNGDKISLLDKKTSFTDINSQPIIQENPYVRSMATEIVSSSTHKDSLTVEGVTDKIKAELGSGAISDPSKATMSDVSKLMQKVSADIDSSLSPTKPSISTPKPTDSDGLESIAPH